MRKGNIGVLAAVFLSVGAVCASGAPDKAETAKATHPLKTKTLVVVARDAEPEAEQSQIRKFDKNFSIRAVNAQQMTEQLREAVRDGKTDGCQSFWLVATGQAASRVINQYDAAVEALSSAGASNYKVVLLNPDEEKVEPKSLRDLEESNLSIVEYAEQGRPDYREAVSRAKAQHAESILSWIAAQDVGPADTAWDEITDRDLFKLARVATRTLGPKSLPAKKETPPERKLTRADTSPIVPDAYEKAIAQMIVDHPRQKRREMVYCPYLNLVARAKAIDITRRKYPGHVDPDGYGPNYVLQSLGYELPKNYGSAKNANMVESIVGQWWTTSGEPLGRSTEDAELFAAEALRNWMTSPPHRRHLLGDDDHSRSQTRYGVGFAYTDYRAKSGQLMRAKMVAFIAAPPSLKELPPLTDKVVYDYLTRTPARREASRSSQKE